MMANERVKPHHLKRMALVYVRQSTVQQVRMNRESTRRQYALGGQALRLGWSEELIRTIDADLAVSGSLAGERGGFSELLDEVAHGRVGAVFGLEVSRLARNTVEWFQLLDWSRATDTLLVEGGEIYSPVRHDDNLVLGIKGTMSEAEAYLIRERMRGGLQNKASRGELYHHVPIGFVLDGKSLVKDPDQQVRHAVEAVFRHFRQQGSARQAVQTLLAAGQKMPSRLPGKHGQVKWSETTYDRVVTILRNPAMGGAYVYGRQRTERVLDEEDRVRRVTKRVPREEWQVLIEDHHAGYVTWSEWEAIQEQLSANTTAKGRTGAVREGPALLAGRALCGECGRYLQVRYGKDWWSYFCPKRVERTGRDGGCMTVGGKRVDRWVAGELLATGQEAGAEAVAHAWEQRRAQEQEALRSQKLEVERCAYEERLAARRYSRVDPDNRLVAGTLEKQWERALKASEQARAHLEQARRALPERPPLERLETLGADLREVWEAECVSDRDRKRLLHCLVENVTLSVDREAKTVRMVLHWYGGGVDEHTMNAWTRARRAPRDSRGTVELVRNLTEHHSDAMTAKVLNSQKRTTARGLPFTRGRVASLRQRHGIPGYRKKPTEKGASVLSVEEAAQQLGVSPGTMYRWIREGLVPAERVTAGAPYRIRLTDELRQRFCDEVPDNFVPLREAMRLLGVTRQRIWQRIRDKELESKHVRRGKVKGLYVRLEAGAATGPCLPGMGPKDG